MDRETRDITDVFPVPIKGLKTNRQGVLVAPHLSVCKKHCLLEGACRVLKREVALVSGAFNYLMGMG